MASLSFMNHCVRITCVLYLNAMGIILAIHLYIFPSVIAVIRCTPGVKSQANLCLSLKLCRMLN